MLSEKGDTTDVWLTEPASSCGHRRTIAVPWTRVTCAQCWALGQHSRASTQWILSRTAEWEDDNDGVDEAATTVSTPAGRPRTFYGLDELPDEGYPPGGRDLEN